MLKPDVQELKVSPVLNFFPAILGVHSMLTQSQSHWAEKPDAGKSLRGSGLKKYKPGQLKLFFIL